MNENKKNKQKEEIKDFGMMEAGEDATKYGEFISSFFSWVSLKDQKEIVDKLEDIDKNKDK